MTALSRMDSLRKPRRVKMAPRVSWAFHNRTASLSCASGEVHLRSQFTSLANRRILAAQPHVDSRTRGALGPLFWCSARVGGCRSAFRTNSPETRRIAETLRIHGTDRESPPRSSTESHGSSGFTNTVTAGPNGYFSTSLCAGPRQLNDIARDRTF